MVVKPLTIRPFDIGTYPKENFVRFVEEEADNYNFGLLEYSAPIEDREISHFSLAPVSDLLPYNEKVFDWYEGNLGQVFIYRDKGNIPYAKIYLYEKDFNEEAIEEKTLTGQQFLRKVKDADYKLGDLKKDNFATIWQDDNYKQFRKKLLTGRKNIEICANCSEGTKVWSE